MTIRYGLFWSCWNITLATIIGKYSFLFLPIWSLCCASFYAGILLSHLTLSPLLSFLYFGVPNWLLIFRFIYGMLINTPLVEPPYDWSLTPISRYNGWSKDIAYMCFNFILVPMTYDFNPLLQAIKDTREK